MLRIPSCLFCTQIVFTPNNSSCHGCSSSKTLMKQHATKKTQIQTRSPTRTSAASSSHCAASSSSEHQQLGLFAVVQSSEIPQIASKFRESANKAHNQKTDTPPSYDTNRAYIPTFNASRRKEANKTRKLAAGLKRNLPWDAVIER